MATDRFSIIFNKGATYRTGITITGVADIATATLWRVRCAMPNEAAFLEATTANGMIIAGTGANNKILVVPAATTAGFPLGNGRYDLEIEWAGGVVMRYLAGQPLQVVPKVGS